MQVVDQMDLVATVAERYRHQYRGSPPERILSDGKTVGATQTALDALPKDAAPAEVDKIIGNDSWTKVFCRECARYFTQGVIFCEGGDDFSACLDCLTKAVRKASKT